MRTLDYGELVLLEAVEERILGHRDSNRLIKFLHELRQLEALGEERVDDLDCKAACEQEITCFGKRNGENLERALLSQKPKLS